MAFIAGTALLLATESANAAVMTFTDTINPNPDQLISFGNKESYSFTHNIIADQDGAGAFSTGIYGYNPLTDIISGASIALRFKDEDTDTALESVQLIFDAQSYGTQIITNGGSIYTATISSGWGSLINDGILNVTLQNAGITNNQQEDRSDFIFLESTLTVDVNRTIQESAALQVPEPAPFTLILMGLAGLVFSHRKPSLTLN